VLTRVVVVALAAGVLSGPAAASSQPWKKVTVTRHAGSVTAMMSIKRQSRGQGFYNFRSLRLVVRVGGKTIVGQGLCGSERCSIGSHHTLTLENVTGGPLKEAVVSLYTGGAHCCFESAVALVDGPHRGRVLVHNWGDPGYEGHWHDGVYDFITADDRFAYAFTSFAASGLPMLVLTIDPAGHFADVTSTRLDLVKADAKQWWKAYLAERGKPDGEVRGVLAAWCADEYRLGEKPTCITELANALKKGWLHGPGGDIWPQSAKYVAALQRSLAKWGYTG